MNGISLLCILYQWHLCIDNKVKMIKLQIQYHLRIRRIFGIRNGIYPYLTLQDHKQKKGLEVVKVKEQ